jgi:hypothetical protein
MSNEDRDDPQPRRLLYEMQERLETVRRRVRREQALSNVSENAHLQLAEAIVEYHDMLYKYRQEGAVADSFPEIPDIRDRMGDTAYIMQEAPGDTNNQRPVERPALLELSTQRLLDAARELEDVSLTLGFAATATPDTQGGSRLRGQDIHEARFAGNSDFADSTFYEALYEDIEGDREGGAIIVVDAEDARTGVGKTSAAVAFGKYIGNVFNYELQKRDLVLSGQEYLNLYNEQPGEDQVSVAVWDEAVGAGSGDARRAMAQENVDLGRAWQVMRTQRVVSLVTLPDWGDLDSRLQKLADYRLWARRDIGQVQAYEIGTTFQGGDLRTRGLGPGDGAEVIKFPDMKEIEDPHYLALKDKKDALIQSGGLDADEMHEDAQEQAETDTGPDLHAIADQVADNVDEYVSVHGGNKTEYLDKDLIEVDFELSGPKADKVKKLVQRKGVAP